MFLFDLGRSFAEQLLYVYLAGVAAGAAVVPPFFGVLYAAQLLLQLAQRLGVAAARLPLLALRSLRCNPVRTSLSFFAVFVLVLMVTMIWSLLGFLDEFTREKQAGDLKVIVSDRYDIFGYLPPRYPREVLAKAMELPPALRPPNGEADLMAWTFVIGSTEPDNPTTPDNTLGLIAMLPERVMTMFDGLEEFTPGQLRELAAAADRAAGDKQAAVLGQQWMTKFGKSVGDRLTLTSSNFAGLKFDLEIVGVFPPGRFDQSAVMHSDYLFDALNAYERDNGVPHPMARKAVNFVWLRLPSEEAFEAFAGAVESPGAFDTRLRVETASSSLSNLFAPYRDLLWGMRWLLAPAILATMALVIANAISIGVRERRSELAVLKVLGFRPWMVMALVLGEAVLVGGLAGVLSAGSLYALVLASGGVPLGFLPSFFIPAEAVAWGLAVGVGTAVAGSLGPALAARSVRAAEVFSRVS